MKKLQPMGSIHKLVSHLARNFFFGLLFIVIALFMGMSGYHYFENLSWIDSFINASMILSGMGPLCNPASFGGKLFAGCYALFSGLAFIVIIAIIFAPLIHRFFHRLHIEINQ